MGSKQALPRRAVGLLLASILGLAVFGPRALAQTNPVPLINQPLVPDAAAPGGAAFTLTVSGTGFVTGSVVDWNGTARATTFVTGSQLTATILASDIVASSTASVTVISPGDVTSNVIFFPIAAPVQLIGLTRADLTAAGGAFSEATADFNGDGKLDLAAVGQGDSVVVLLGNGDGTFQSPVQYPTGTDTLGVAVGDFNGDGKLDLAVVCEFGGLSVLLGNGDGSFGAAVTYAAGLYPYAVATADFNGDGKPDLAVANEGDNDVSIFLANGDGTFKLYGNFATAAIPQNIVVGDFNDDDQLDLAVSTCGVSACDEATAVSVLLGNGDGSFQAHVDYPTDASRFGVTADLNGDGKLDLAFSSQTAGVMAVMFGNGDGTFQNLATYNVGLGPGGFPVAVDFNGDGVLDLAVPNYGSNSVSILLGNGDGSFQPQVSYATGSGPFGLTVGDFNNDGRLDLIAGNEGGSSLSVLLQGSAVTLSPTSVNFGNQLLGVVSPPQIVTLSTSGPITITSIATSAQFTQTNNCGTSLGAGGSCTISVTFMPTTLGLQNGTLTVNDSGVKSPQIVSLSGTGVQPAVTLSPTSLTFPTQTIFTIGKGQPVTLTNTGTGTLAVTSIGVTGQFGQKNTCGSSVNPGASCTIYVTFRPTSKGTLTGSVSIADNAPGSPQKVALAGTGTYVQLSAASLNFGSQPVHTTSLPQKITLTNKGSIALNITSISITGADPGDFAQTDTCGSRVAAGASCFITVTFTPLAKGKRTASVSVNDNGGGSPQKVGLTGVGT